MDWHLNTYYRHGNIDVDTWWIQDMCGNYCYLLEGTQKAVLIDAGIGLPGLRTYVEGLTKRPVTVILTHGHLDHIGSCGEWHDVKIHVEDVETLKLHQSAAYRILVEGLMCELGINLPKDILELCIHIQKPQHLSFMREQEIKLGGRQLEVIHTPGHTKGSVCLLEKKRKMLFSGDTVCEKRVMLSFPESQSADTYVDSLKKLWDRKGDIRNVYPGHNQIPIACEWIQQYYVLAGQIINATEKLIAREECSIFGKCRVYGNKEAELTYKFI